MLQSSDLWYWMIWNRMFDIKYNYHGHASAGDWVLQLPMVEVFIPRVVEVTTAKEFITHRLVLDLNHLIYILIRRLIDLKPSKRKKYLYFLKKLWVFLIYIHIFTFRPYNTLNMFSSFFKEIYAGLWAASWELFG